MNTPLSKMALLDLSGELRNQIWRYALVEENAIAIPATNTSEPLQPGLLSVNRQLRAECTDIYYNENTFYLEVEPRRTDSKLKHPWFAAIGPERAQQIRKLTIDLEVPPKDLVEVIEP